MQTRYRFRFAVWLGLLFVLVAAPRGASADREEALQHWKKGETAYSLGRFDEAIGHFERAYVAHPAPAFTFNIAQCHRQLKNCERAAFFYRRYLSMEPDAENRDEVKGFIDEMESMCAKARDDHEPRVEDQDRNVRPAPPATEATASARSQDAPASDQEERAILTTVVEAGPAFIGMGDVEVPARPSVRLGVAYPFGFGAIGVEPGALVNVTPIATETGTAWLTSLLASTAGTYRLAARWRLRAEAGVGVLLFGGLGQGNPFTDGGRPTTGPLGMFNVRAAVGADYLLGDSLIVSATPLAFAVSPAKDGLDPSIDRITRLDMLIGLGYRL